MTAQKVDELTSAEANPACAFWKLLVVSQAGCLIEQ
jgi:hypothetical protein